MGLKEYRAKRDFKKTGEPKGKVGKTATGRVFVVQKHAARRLHYDVRLEAGGVLKSWAVPRGPSYDVTQKRLAVQVEDHPIDYGDFEGIIPEKQYGAGTVMVWDKGTWKPEGDLKDGLESGKLKFHLEGRKLKGLWTLVRIKSGDGEKKNWLLIKDRDEEAKKKERYDVTSKEPLSVKTGRTIEEIKADRKSPQWISDEVEEKGDFERESASLTAKGKKAPWPVRFFPQLATLVSKPPEGDQWLYEIKFDGYRLLARLNKGRIDLMTRRGLNWTEKFGPIAEEFSRLPVNSAIIDGEVVIQNPDGTTDFQKLQNYLKQRGKGTLLYYAFDLPYFNGRDLSAIPLTDRKKLLRELIAAYRDRIPSILYSDHLTGEGGRVFEAACSHLVEGIVAKRADSPYVQGRTRYWLKTKCIKRQEFVIGGYTAPKGSRSYFGSLLLGYYNKQGQLIYCGNVGTGFDSGSIKYVFGLLKPLRQDNSPFSFPIEDRLRRHVFWTSPRVVAQVEFSSWTDDGLLRHPSFIGIREDKEPEEITLEEEVPPDRAVRLARSAKKKTSVSMEGIELSHPEKVLYPDVNLTKKDLAEYYTRIEKWVMPELVRRPLTLVRCPEGISQKCFFQKHIENGVPEWIKTVPVKEKKETELALYVDDLKGLLSLVQMSVLEIHTWGSRIDKLEYPDRMVFDLDPSPEVSKEQLAMAALFFREWLVKNNVDPLFKTTGGKGLHVIVPLKPTLDWKQVRKIAEGIAREMVSIKPDLFIATITKKVRTGKILIDYFRNTRGATFITPYSTRARPGAPVALPISQKELTGKFLSRHFSIRETMERMGKLKKNPWRELY